ncbi:MAG: hypothetical protein KDC48_01935 [Planctomycetes bacterium]|nr:hypothetical protein [Planctomycetota bacterium]
MKKLPIAAVLVCVMGVAPAQERDHAGVLRGSLQCERPAEGAQRVHSWKLRANSAGGLERFGKNDLFERAPDAVAVAGPDGTFALEVPPGSYAVFAFVDRNGDGTWSPDVPEPCAWRLRVDVPAGGAELAALQLRAPTHLARQDRVVANGALRWCKGYPVVQLRGDARQRGVAHGELLAAQIVDFFRDYILEDRLGGAVAYREFETFLNTAFVWPDAFLQEIDGVLVGMQQSGIDLSVPELGRDFGRCELLAINAYIETRAMRSSCTQFVAFGERTAGSEIAGGTIAGRNMDGEIDLRRVTVSHFVLFAVDPSESGQQRFVSMMWPGFVGTLSGFNAAGVHCMENAGGTGPGPVVDRLQPISWVMRQALATFGSDATHADFESLLAAHANSAGGACGPGCIVVFALPSAAREPGWILEGDRFGHASRLPGAVSPRLAGAVMASNHHLVYGADPDRPGTSFGRQPSPSSAWRYEAGQHKLQAWARTGRAIGTAEMRELLQTVAHGSTEHSIITRPDLREFDVAVASMRAEPWDAPYRPWTTFRFDELFAEAEVR